MKERIQTHSFFPAPKKQLSHKIELLNSRSIVFNDSIDRIYTNEWTGGRLPKEMNMDIPFETSLEYKINGDTLTINIMHIDYYKNKYEPILKDISKDTIWLGFRGINNIDNIHPIVIHLNTWKLRIKDKSRKFKPIIFYNPKRYG